MLQFSSSPKNLREQQVIEYYLPLCIQLAYLPSVRSKVLVLKRSSYPAQNIQKYSSSMLTFLSCQKASLASLLYLNRVSFLISLVSRIAILEKFLINYQLKFRNSKKNCIFLTILGVSYFLTTLIFSSLIRTLLTPTVYPKKSTSFLQNLHFSSFTRKLYQSRHLSTVQTCLTQSSLFLEQTRILSKYAIIKISKCALNTLLISF